MDAVVEWVDARERLPRDRDGWPVAAAITGFYPPDDPEAPGYPFDDPQDTELEFWLVRPMYFTSHHIADDGTEYDDCFVDSDGVVRLPYGRPCDEPVTHWAALPTLPGMTVHGVLGAEARTALRNILGEGMPGKGRGTAGVLTKPPETDSCTAHESVVAYDHE
jgi:hypothetical protein